MANSSTSTYPVDEARTEIAVAYRNAQYLADWVFPRVPVNLLTYKYMDYPLAESFTIPETRIGRRSAPNMVHFTASEQTSSCVDYALSDVVPHDDIRNAPRGADPVDRSVMLLSDLIALDRERRVAGLAFDASEFGNENKLALSGESQWSHADADPIRAIEDAKYSMLMMPTKLLFGPDVWRSVSTHPRVLKAVNRSSGDSGVATPAQVGDILQLEVRVGLAWATSSKPGQPPTLARLWGKKALMFHDSPNAGLAGPPTFGVTAQYGDRVTRVGHEDKLGGLRGGTGLIVGESVDERIIASRAGYLFDAAVA